LEFAGSYFAALIIHFLQNIFEFIKIIEGFDFILTLIMILKVICSEPTYQEYFTNFEQMTFSLFDIELYFDLEYFAISELTFDSS
jgi:hypothetical protein